MTAARVEAQQLAREAASEAGVPTALPVLGRDGERAVVVDGCVVDVEVFVDNDAKMDTPGRIASAMPWLGRLHDALASVQLPPDGNDLRFANFIAADELVPLVVAGASRIRSIAPRHTKIGDSAQEVAVRLERASAVTPLIAPQWCHGDYWDNNVLFQGDNVCLVTDFGFMNQRPRIDDLALTLYFVLWGLHAAHDTDPLRQLATLVMAYESGMSHGLSALERESLPLAIARQPLWSVGVWAAQLDDPAAVDAHLEGHDIGLQLATSVLDDLDRWTSAFSERV